MKKIVYGILATVSGLVLLFSYRTSLGESVPAAEPADTTTSGSAAATPVPTTSPDSVPTASATASPSASGGTSTSTGSTADSGLTDGTYTGQAANTRYGPVQVRITVSGGKITAVDVPEYPTTNPRDAQINRTAVPRLVSETLAAQSSDIDMVSGATYTSDGYLQSLQSAIDEARG